MDYQLSWQKGAFDSTYQVFSKDELAFSLIFATFQSDAVASTKLGIYRFRSNLVIDIESKILNQHKEEVGQINFNWLKFSAKVSLKNGEVYDWVFQNKWLSRWSINNSKGEYLIFNAESGKGTATGNTEQDLLAVCGIFIREYFRRLIFLMFLVVSAIFTFKQIF